VFEAVIELLEPPAVNDEGKKKAEEKDAAKDAAEKAAADAKTKAKKNAEEDAKAKAKEAAERKKKRTKKEKKSSKNQRSPSSDGIENEPQNNPPWHQVKTAEVYTAFKLNYCKIDPPEEEYEKLRKNTQDFFKKQYVCIHVVP
jgi:hypothetical protein